jgi:hypothetical protein
VEGDVAEIEQVLNGVIVAAMEDYSLLHDSFLNSVLVELKKGTVAGEAWISADDLPHPQDYYY